MSALSKLWPRQIKPSTNNGDVLTTVAGVTVWAAATATLPLLDDQDANPLAADDGSDWLYPDP